MSILLFADGDGKKLRYNEAHTDEQIKQFFNISTLEFYLRGEKGVDDIAVLRGDLQPGTYTVKGDPVSTISSKSSFNIYLRHLHCHLHVHHVQLLPHLQHVHFLPHLLRLQIICIMCILCIFCICIMCVCISS